MASIEQMTTIDGILTAEMDHDEVTITLKPDAGGDDIVITIPSFKFRWIANTFAAEISPTL